MKYNLKEVQPKKPDNISCNYYLPNEELEDKIDVLIVSFYGDYPNGSEGNNYATFITRNVISGIIEFNPDAIILDFRELSYSWGNSILDVFEQISFLKDSENTKEDPNFPVSIVVSEKSKNGFLSLLIPNNSNELPSWIFENIDKAIQNAAIKGKYWLDN